MYSTSTLTKSILWIVIFASHVKDITSKACCPDGWISYKSHCYLIGYEPRTFMEAHHFCSVRNAYLVRIEDYWENAFLKQLLRNLKATNTWTGLSDQRSEGYWRWEGTNTHATYTDWAPGEPNNYKNTDEDCAAFRRSENYKWNDFRCYYKHLPLCEKNEI